MGVEAGRAAVGQARDVGALYYATTAPAHADKTNAAILHAALGLPRPCVPIPSNDGTDADLTAPALFSLLVPAYMRAGGVDEESMKRVMTRIAFKNHANRAKNPRAQSRKEVSEDDRLLAPRGRAVWDLRVLGRRRRSGRVAYRPQ